MHLLKIKTFSQKKLLQRGSRKENLYQIAGHNYQPRSISETSIPISVTTAIGKFN